MRRWPCAGTIGAIVCSALVVLVALVLLIPLVPLAAVAAEPMRLTIDGRERTFLLERPAAQGPRSTIVVLHGATGTGAQAASRTGLGELAPRAGFVAAFPDGLRNRWNHYLPGKELPAFVEDSRQVGGVPDDVGFLTALVADLVRRGISDPKRIYFVGHSNGGFMTLRMICADASLMAGAALLVSGMPEVLGSECRPAKPVPVLMVNGTADQTVPYVGGRGQPGGTVEFWSTERLVAFLRERNGCAGTPEQSVLPDTGRSKVEVARWTRCSGAPVDFYRVIGGDHFAAWTFNSGQAVLDFFRDKVRDGAVAAASPSGAAARPQQAAAGALRSIAYRRYDGPTLVTGDVKRTAGEEWLETNTRGSRWSFRTTAETSAEVTLYDASRDVHVRLDLAGKKMFVRKGATQPWSPLADIVGIEK
jgi:polyhydroxybutyrate depolymerase